jgi:putative ABC transport system permease protein
VIPEAQKQAFLANRRGCVIGRETATRYGWKVGDVFYLESFIPPYRKGEPFDFVIEAIYDTDDLKYPGTDASQMFFHYEYLDEAVKDNHVGVGTFVVEIEDPDRAGSLSKEIDALFANSSAESHTETEAAFRAGFIAMAGNLAVAFTILLVTANTMSMAVRERRTEIGVLKTLGFPSGTVMGLILAESVALGALGGAVGIGAGFAGLGILGHMPAVGDVLRQFQAAGLGLSPLVAGTGFALSLAIGAAAGFVPALLAFRARITDILRAA